MSVIGTITTDGTIGTISEVDLQGPGWDLFVSDGSTTTEITAANGYFGTSDPANLFQATSSELTYNAAGGTGYDLFWGPGTDSFFCLQAAGGCSRADDSDPGYAVSLNSGASSPLVYNVPESGVFVVGTTEGASAPEPAPGMLMIGGLGISLLVRSRIGAQATKTNL